MIHNCGVFLPTKLGVWAICGSVQAGALELLFNRKVFTIGELFLQGFDGIISREEE